MSLTNNKNKTDIEINRNGIKNDPERYRFMLKYSFIRILS